MARRICLWHCASVQGLLSRGVRLAAVLTHEFDTAGHTDLTLCRCLSPGRSGHFMSLRKSAHLEARELIVDGLLRGAVQHAGVVDDVLRRRLWRLQHSHINFFLFLSPVLAISGLDDTLVEIPTADVQQQSPSSSCCYESSLCRATRLQGLRLSGSACALGKHCKRLHMDCCRLGPRLIHAGWLAASSHA
jgi:hypothetical protein